MTDTGSGLALTPYAAPYSSHLLPLCILALSRLLLPLAGTSYPHKHDICGQCARWAHTAPTAVSLEHLARDPQLLQLHMLAQLTQVIHIEDLLPKLEAADGRKGMGPG